MVQTADYGAFVTWGRKTIPKQRQDFTGTEVLSDQNIASLDPHQFGV